MWHVCVALGRSTCRSRELRGLFELKTTGPSQQHLGALVGRPVEAIDQRITDLLRMKEDLAKFEPN